MEKFLSLQVTGEQRQLVAATDVVLVEQASITTVTLNYGGGKVVTITHTELAASIETMRDFIQNSLLSALSTGWTSPAYVANIPASVVSAAPGAVTITGIAVS